MNKALALIPFLLITACGPAPVLSSSYDMGEADKTVPGICNDQVKSGIIKNTAEDYLRCRKNILSLEAARIDFLDKEDIDLYMDKEIEAGKKFDYGQITQQEFALEQGQAECDMADAIAKKLSQTDILLYRHNVENNVHEHCYQKLQHKLDGQGTYFIN